LDAEPRFEEEPEQGTDDRVVEVRVEAELVDAGLSAESLPQEIGDGADLLHDLIAGLLDNRGAATMLIDFAYDSGDLVGGGPWVGVGDQRGMLARGVRTLP